MISVNRIKVVDGNLLVRMVDEEKKVGRLYVPDQRLQRVRPATVVAAGADSPYPVGSKVLISFYVGMELDTLALSTEGGDGAVDSGNYRIISEGEVLATVTE